MEPAKMFPRVTGIKFLQRQSSTDTSAPAIIPMGIMNMLAGICSKPMATKQDMGNQMPTILPTMSCAWPCRNTAMHTNQLQPIPLRKVTPKFSLIFFSATLIASSLVRPTFKLQAVTKPAKSKAPSRLPSQARANVLAICTGGNLPSNTAAGTVAAVPVISTPPVRRMSSRFTGKSAANTKV
ncbi:unnamed protein product [Prorocentrum cordatum]|uniref:Uncharacterized protein n=1 Tax=Prorocentrum cordatum TaxID=2364126 RepID=A0ABN9PUP8_9DINO|nr:unnamed protein product [Polarella glacialis]